MEYLIICLVLFFSSFSASHSLTNSVSLETIKTALDIRRTRLGKLTLILEHSLFFLVKGVAILTYLQSLRFLLLWFGTGASLDLLFLK